MTTEAARRDARAPSTSSGRGRAALPATRCHLIAQRRSATAPQSVTVVGIDGSTASRAAVGWAVDHATAPVTELVVVHAVRLLSALVRDIPPLGTVRWRSSLQGQIVGDWCRPIHQAGLPYRAYLTDSSPAWAILDLATRTRASTVVLGGPTSGLTQRMVGSVTDHVVRRAPCPVVVVPDTTGS